MDQTMHTPYFIIDEPVLTHYYDMLTRSLSENWDNYLIGYSFKTNSLPWLVSYMKKKRRFRRSSVGRRIQPGQVYGLRRSRDRL